MKCPRCGSDDTYDNINYDEPTASYWGCKSCWETWRRVELEYVSPQFQVKEAMENMKRVDYIYYVQTLESRTDGPDGVGSRFTGCETWQAVEDMLLSLDWHKFMHPAIAPTCRGFVAQLSIPGKLGIIPVESLPRDVPIKLVARKGLTMIEAQVSRESLELDEFMDRVGGIYPADRQIVNIEMTAGHVVMIVGDEDGISVMFTCHPGDPVSPSDAAFDERLNGEYVTPVVASVLGFDYIKLVD